MNYMIQVFTEKVDQVWFGVAFKGESIIATNFASTKEKLLAGLKKSVPSSSLTEATEKTELAKKAMIALQSLYNGKEISYNFTFAKDHLPKYTWKILDTVSRVPVGYVTSYGEVSKAVGGSPRAVGQIMAKNPFAPFCPCHRIVRSNFTLGGYGGGLDVKLAFLKREKHGHNSEKELALNGKKLKVFPAELAIRKAEEDKH
jgi:methylated-DNA-[protein]-cysteine S-methyltransferase